MYQMEYSILGILLVLMVLALALALAPARALSDQVVVAGDGSISIGRK